MSAESATAVPRPPARTAPAPVLTGAQAVVRSLDLLGVTDVFGLPGGAIMPVYDPLMDDENVRHILVRHEQGAGHAAEGYAAASGRTGVAIATSGPGATNLVTAIADAYMDSVPLVCITGQVFSTLMGTDAFQEADIVGITMPITKHSFLVKTAEDIPGAIAAAFEIASTGRPGPVLVDITKDAQQAEAPFVWPPKIDLPGYRPVTKAHGKQIQAAAQLIAAAKKPVLYVGGGVIRAKASAELKTLAEATGAPLVTTLMARGAFPDSHEQHLGMPGMHGTVPAVLALQESDLIVSLGARFDDRVTGKAALFAPNAQVVHVDIDPAEISKIRTADVPIVGDLKDVLVELEAAFRQAASETEVDYSEWWAFLNGLREEFPLGYTPTTDGLLSPQHVIQRIGEMTGPEGIYAAGVGQHQMWAAQYYRFDEPRRWINSGGLGTMGFSVPAALGAKAGCPDKEVWAIDGDGCFQMTNQELTTAAMEGFPIKVALINNGNLGMVRQWQTLFYDGHYSHTKLGGEEVYVPDFVKLSEALGAEAIRVTKEEEVVPAIKKAREINDRPVVVEFIVGENAQVWPMIAAGASNSDMQYALGMRPFFDMEESAGETPEAISETIDALDNQPAQEEK